VGLLICVCCNFANLDPPEGVIHHLARVRLCKTSVQVSSRATPTPTASVH
jgi:hypothetical protein